MIETTKQEVEAEYSMANGHKFNAEVIYGDTDSVMVKFGPEDLETVMTLGLPLHIYLVASTDCHQAKKLPTLSLPSLSNQSNSNLRRSTIHTSSSTKSDMLVSIGHNRTSGIKWIQKESRPSEEITVGLYRRSSRHVCTRCWWSGMSLGRRRTQSRRYRICFRIR